MQKIAFFGVQQIGVMMKKFKDPSVGDVALVHIDSPNSCTAIWVISNFHQTLSGLTKFESVSLVKHYIAKANLLN